MESDLILVHQNASMAVTQESTCSPYEYGSVKSVKSSINVIKALDQPLSDVDSGRPTYADTSRWGSFDVGQTSSEPMDGRCKECEKFYYYGTTLHILQSIIKTLVGNLLL